MAKILRTCGLLVYFIIYVCATDETASEPRIVSINVKELSCFESNCKYLLDVRGGEYLGHLSWRLTPEASSKSGSCDVIYANYELREIVTNQWKTTLEIVVPNSEGKIYFCLYYSVKKNSPFGGRWMHQGRNLFLNPKTDVASPKKDELSTTAFTNEQIDVGTQKSNLQETNTEWGDLSHDTDVNYLPNVARPTRNERRDIEVFFKNKYIPLNAVYGFKNDLKASNGVEEFNDTPNSGVKFDSNNKRDMSTQTYNADLEVKNFDPLDIDESKMISNILKKREITDTLLNIDDNRKFSNHIDGFKSQNGAIYTEKSLNLNQHVKKRHMPTQTYNEDFEKIYLDKFESYLNVSKIRDKREIIKPLQSIESNDTLISAKDILEAKKHKENEIKKTVRNEELQEDALIRIRKERQTTDAAVLDFTSVKTVPVPIKIEGLRVENSEKEPKLTENGIPSVLADTGVTIRLFGQGFTSRTVISFTYDSSNYGELCKFILKGEHLVKKDSVTSNSALVELKAPAPETESNILYICAKNLKSEISDPSKEDELYIHQGSDPWIALATHNKLLPLWMTLTLIMICLMFSALFSGLNLGLMSLDRTELKIISNTGTERERKYARAIMPVRDHGNYLLCSILLGNVAVNSTFTILLDELTSGLFAVIFSTLAIVLLGEITPQAICSRHGLMVGAKSIMVTKAVMALTAPLAYPVSKLLDYFLGEEIGSVYNRERLKELVKVTTDVNDLDKEEVNIISGALELRKKTVSDVMTKLEDVFMLPITSILDFETMSEIIKSGYSRIPVYEGSRTNIVTVLFIKDLAFVDPDDNTPLQTLCQYYQNPCNFVFEDVTLDVMFKQFKDGHKGHMAFVHRINNEGEGDPFYETIGLVTLEDVIEEMIQSEIVDETDVFMDNRTKRRRNRPQNKLQDFAAFAERHENQRIHISPQLTLATFQFLSTSVDAFRPDTISETVLRRLFKQDVIHYIKLKGKTKKDPSTYVYQQGKPVDYFVLILEGRVEVTVGRENLVFEAGPFTYFGVQALTQNIGVAESPTPSAMGSLQNINMDSMLRHTFVPDYSVRATTELYYLTVKRSLYLAAKRATLMEKGALSKGATNEQFDTEVDKLLQSVDEDISISGEHKTPSRQVSPNPLPVSASPHTRSSFASRSSPEPRNGGLYSGARADEQEKLLK